MQRPKKKGDRSVASPFGLRSSLRQSGGRFAADLDAGLKPRSIPKTKAKAKDKGKSKRQRQKKKQKTKAMAKAKTQK